jgi:hypothetical protein
LNKAYIGADCELDCLVIFWALAYFTPRSGMHVFIIENEMLCETLTEYKCLNKM